MARVKDFDDFKEKFTKLTLFKDRNIDMKFKLLTFTGYPVYFVTLGEHIDAEDTELIESLEDFVKKTNIRIRCFDNPKLFKQPSYQFQYRAG